MVQGRGEGCILRESGTVACWLVKDHERRAAIALKLIEGLPAMVELGMGGGGVACGRTVDGEIWCWKVGAAPDLRLVGVQTRKIDIPPVVKLAVGANDACGVLRDGRIGCWSVAGLPIGIATISRRRSGVVDLSFSEYTLCTLQRDGAARCTTPSPPARSFANISEVHGGGFTTCFLKNNGALSCLEEGKAASPMTIAIPMVQRISIGSEHACAQTQHGIVYCWGYNTFGAAVPQSPWFRVRRPTRVGSFGTNWNIEAHSTVTCVVSLDGDRRCWGRCNELPALPRLSCESLPERYFPGWRQPPRAHRAW